MSRQSSALSSQHSAFSQTRRRVKTEHCRHLVFLFSAALRLPRAKRIRNERTVMKPDNPSIGQTVYTMNIKVKPLANDPIERRCKNGQLFDVVDYPFQVSNGRVDCTVKVGITGTFHDPAEALGSKKLSRDELVEAAQAWLRSRIEKGECDPFTRPETDTVIDMPSAVMDYWVEH